VGSGLPGARAFEALLEICYTAQLKTGWTLQPDFQDIWQPGGGVPRAVGQRKSAERGGVGRSDDDQFLMLLAKRVSHPLLAHFAKQAPACSKL
jgi:hypothetical protein